MWFAAHSDNEELVAAVGLGNVIINCFVISIFWSLNSSIDTLASQAYGAGNLKLCGVYLN